MRNDRFVLVIVAVVAIIGLIFVFLSNNLGTGTGLAGAGISCASVCHDGGYSRGFCLPSSAGCAIPGSVHESDADVFCTDKLSIDAFCCCKAGVQGSLDDDKNVQSVEVGTEFVYAAGQRIAKIRGNDVFFFVNDHLGSPRKVLNAVSAVVSELDYLPFGTEMTDSNEDFKYTGKEQDLDSGLHYYGARYYDADIGRFITPDTVEAFPNPYVYVANNPMKYIDPTGQQIDYNDEFKKAWGEGFRVIAATAGGSPGNQRGTQGAWERVQSVTQGYMIGGDFNLREFDFKNIFGKNYHEGIGEKWSDFILEETKDLVAQSGAEYDTGTTCAGFGLYLLFKFANKMDYDTVSLNLERGGVNDNWVRIFNKASVRELESDNRKWGNYKATFKTNKVKDSWFQQGPLASTNNIERNSRLIKGSAKTSGLNKHTAEDILEQPAGTILFESHEGRSWGHTTIIINKNDVPK